MLKAYLYCCCTSSVALKNPEVVARRGGLSTILKSVIDCQLSRINEALITTILHLLNHPNTRQYVRIDVELEVRRRSFYLFGRVQGIFLFVKRLAAIGYLFLSHRANGNQLQHS